MFQVNWLTLLLVILAFILIRIGLQGTYLQFWNALTSIPVTPAQASGQTSAPTGRIAP